MAAIRNTLTYLVPDSLAVQPGQRVQVPLATRKATGIVLRAGSTLPPGIQARPILRVLDTEPVLSPELLELGLWIADYYVAPIGEVFRAMLPLRSATRRARLVRLSESGRRKLQELMLADEAKLTRRVELLNYLPRAAASPPSAPPEVPRAFLEALKEKWLVVDEVERERTQRQVYAVRLAGPVPEKPARLSPVAKRILEVLGAEGAAGDHRELLQRCPSGSCRPQKAERLRPGRTDSAAAERPLPLGSNDVGSQADSSLVLTPAQTDGARRPHEATGVRTVPDRAPPWGNRQREDGSLSPVDCPLPRDRPHGSDAGARNCPHPLRAGAVPGPIRLEGGASAQRLIRKRAPRGMVAHSPRRSHKWCWEHARRFSLPSRTWEW